MAQPFADLSNLGSAAPAAASSSLQGKNIVGSNAADDDAPGASTQAALDRLLGGSNAHKLALDAAAAKVAMVRIWLTEAESGQICTGWDRPTNSGPITVASPSSRTSLVAIEAE